MPLTQLQLSASLQTTMTKALNAFGNGNVGPVSMAFNLVGINLLTWNQTFEQVYTLFAVAPSGLTATAAAGGSLTANTTYYYKVTAVGYNGFNASNETSGSNEASAATTSSNQTINLTWTALPGAVSYNVYRGTAAGAENLLVANATSTSYSDNGTASTVSQSPPGSMPNDYIEFDLSSYTTLANEAATPGHALGIIVLPTGTVGSSQCTLAPGQTNGLTWFFSGTNPAIAVPINGIQLLCGPPSGATGQAISGTSKTLRITNAGSQATTVQIGVITGP